MDRTKWVGSLATILCGSGFTLAQMPSGYVSGGSTAVITIHEPGKSDHQCRVVKSWRDVTGQVAYEIQAMDTGERMTIYDNAARDASAATAASPAYPTVPGALQFTATQEPPQTSERLAPVANPAMYNQPGAIIQIPSDGWREHRNAMMQTAGTSPVYTPAMLTPPTSPMMPAPTTPPNMCSSAGCDSGQCVTDGTYTITDSDSPGDNRPFRRGFLSLLRKPFSHDAATPEWPTPEMPSTDGPANANAARVALQASIAAQAAQAAALQNGNAFTPPRQSTEQEPADNRSVTATSPDWSNNQIRSTMNQPTTDWPTPQSQSAWPSATLPQPSTAIQSSDMTMSHQQMAYTDAGTTESGASASSYTGIVPSSQQAILAQAQQLLAMLREGSYPSQREWAAESLTTAWASNPALIMPALMQSAHEDPAATVRAACVRCIARLNDNPAMTVAALQAMQNDPDPRVRQEITTALATLSTSSHPLAAPTPAAR